ncbi:MAG: MFS transporter [Thermoleophilia bacterium]|nr:MFS transporter [Thermoleophilia bacterium]
MSAAVKRSFASLQIHNYRLYVVGQLTSLAGNWMQIVAELWLILELTGSGTAVGIATALQFLGILLFGVWGGSLADRFDKRRLLIVTQTAMAAPAVALLALSLSGSIEIGLVYGLIALRGLVLAIDNPARQAFVAEIVGRRRIVNAVGINSIIVHSARIAGPALAGVLIAFGGVALCFALNALTFGVMIGALALMRTGDLPAPAEHRPAKAIREGLRYVAATRELRLPLILMAVLGTLGFNFPVITPLLARFSFGGEVSAYSLLMAATAVGAITGSVFAGSRERLGPSMVAVGAAGFGVAGTLAAAAPTLPTEMVAMSLIGGTGVIFAASINSGLQLAAAPEMRGRVMALYSVVFLGSTPIGGPLSGWLGEAVSPRASLLVGGLAGLGVALAAVSTLGAPGTGRLRVRTATGSE